MSDRESKKIALSKGFIHDSFLQMLTSELDTRQRHNRITVEIKRDGWEVVTYLPVAYNPGGYAFLNTQERITHVEVDAVLKFDGTMRGSVQRIKFSPENGFYNLDSCIANCLNSSNNGDQNEPDFDPFLVSSIESMPLHEISIVKPDDWRVVQLVSILTSMDMKGELAQKHALEVVREHPTTHDMDLLLELITAKKNVQEQEEDTENS